MLPQKFKTGTWRHLKPDEFLNMDQTNCYFEARSTNTMEPKGVDICPQD
jgi:hypothetical protein